MASGGVAAASLIQVRVLPQGERAVVAFHQEQLPDEVAREQRRAAFVASLEGLHQLSVEVSRR